MGDLGADTSVVGGDGSYGAELSEDWEIWGPMGGYLAGVALRAAGAECGRARPASISAHFTGGVGSGPVDVDVETVRTTRVATSVTVTVSQGGRTGLRALVWGVDAVDGLEHLTDRRPAAVPPADDLPSFQDLVAARREEVVHPFWANFDYRPLNWVDWEGHVPGEPMNEGWYRLVPTPAFTDPWVDAVRLLILVDLDAWPAAHRAHPLDVPWYAPTIEVTARFIGDAHEDPWLRAIGEAPVAANGLVAHRAEVWTPSGRLVANGGSTLLSRPAERRPDRPG